MNKKEKYIAPELTAVSFKVEQGFQSSGQRSLSLAPILNMVLPEFNIQSQEIWEDDGILGDSDWSW